MNFKAMTSAAIFLATACSRPDAIPETLNAEVVSNISNETSPLVTNTNAAATHLSTWTGRWLGPEGLFLEIRPDSSSPLATVSITLKDNLDSEAQYEGKVNGNTISFVRAGKRETIRPGTGAETGFKYLADKTDCLIVQVGKEGYCR